MKLSRTIIGLCGVALAVACIHALGCGSTKSLGFITEPDSGTLTFAEPTSEAEAPEPCGLRCSSDLHSVLDCTNTVVRTCAADQACNGTTCAPACEGAHATKSTLGCDYYAISPDVVPAAAGECYAAVVANTWGTPVTISVERDGQELDPSLFGRIPSGSGPTLSYGELKNATLDPGQVAILFLAQFGENGIGIPALCPTGVTPAYTVADAAVHGTGLGKAFRISTSAPVVAYDIFPYGGGNTAVSSATLLLPTSAWGTNYVAVNAFPQGEVASPGSPSLDIVAQEDGTLVTISPTVKIAGGPGVAASDVGKPITYSLEKGQVLQFTQPEELTGSPIQSNKPIGVWGGSSCLNVGLGTCCCDAAHQQIPPVGALGSEYVAVRYRNRKDGVEEAPPWRIVGLVDGTALTYDPPVDGAPAVVVRGQVLTFEAPGPFVVKSQDDKHPFYFSAYMTGCETHFTGSDCRGDPEFVNVVPAHQYLSSYVFFSDPTYPETNLVLVRAKHNGTFEDVKLDCHGRIGGWTPIGIAGDYEYSRIDLVRDNFVPQGKCDNGRHSIRSDGPFSLTIWGWGSAATGRPGTPFFSQAVSYAYPAGMNVAPINNVIVPAGPR